MPLPAPANWAVSIQFPVEQSKPLRVGIDDPDISDAHFAVVVEVLRVARNSIFGRKNLNNRDGRCLNDLLAGRSDRNNGNVSNAETGRRRLNADFGRVRMPHSRSCWLNHRMKARCTSACSNSPKSLSSITPST